MSNSFQSTEWVEKRTKELFIQNPNRSPLPIFRYFRKNESVSLIGDYPIMWTIINVATLLKIKFDYQVVYRFCRQSEEYKSSPKSEKMLWTKEFLQLNRTPYGVMSN